MDRMIFESDNVQRKGRIDDVEPFDISKRKVVQHQSRLVEILGKIPLFRGVSSHQFKYILAICKRRMLEKNQILCRAGEESFEIYILLKGALRVTFEDGREFSRIVPIGIVGEMGVFTGDRRSATIIADTDCLLLSIHKHEIMRVLRSDADLSTRVLLNVIDDLSEKLKRDNSIIGDLRQICPPGRWTQIIRRTDREK